VLILPMPLGAFQPPKPHLADPPRSSSWTEDKKCQSCTPASWLKNLELHRQDKHPRGPSTSRYKALFYTTDLRSASLRMTALFGSLQDRWLECRSTKDLKRSLRDSLGNRYVRGGSKACAHPPVPLGPVKPWGSWLFLLLQPRVHVLLLKLLELDAVVDALQALVYGALSARSRVLLKELSNIGTLFCGTEGS
jgi:hypothetical protein